MKLLPIMALSIVGLTANAYADSKVLTVEGCAEITQELSITNNNKQVLVIKCKTGFLDFTVKEQPLSISIGSGLTEGGDLINRGVIPVPNISHPK